MANQNNGGRSNTTSDEQRPSWRPQDQSMRDDRDDDRSSTSARDHGRRDQQDEGYRTSERYGQGQSGYGAGRSGEDRSLGFENRNQGYGGRLEDRQQSGMGMDDRFSGRGGQGYYQGGQGGQGGQGREGYGRQDEGLGQRGYGGGERGFGGAENRGYSSGYNMGGQGGGGFGGYGEQRGNEGRGEGDGQQGMGRTGGYAQQSGSGSQGGNRSGQWGQGNQGVHGGSVGGYGQNIGQQGSTQSGFGQEMRGMHRGKGPQGWQRSDERIREMICETLTDDDHIDASHIDIKVTGGEVVLSGTVPDRTMKRMAEDIVERMAGVKDVTNQLKVGRDQERSNASSAGRQVGSKSDTDMPGSSKHRA